MVKRVFFLGAGFSKAINHDFPLMNDLTGNIIDRITKSSVAEHYREIAPLIQGDVESLLTYLSTDFPWKTDTTKHSNLALYSTILELISEQFECLAKQQNYTTFPEIWKNFSRFIKDNANECNFITLNYDTLLEELLSRSYEHLSHKSAIFGKFYQYPMLDICSRNSHSAGGSTIGEELPAILKLHGSANWFWAGVNPSDNIYYRIWSTLEENNIDMGLKPYIIPPVMDKNAFYNHIAIHTLWRLAEKSLKKANEIYIIGFSFPQTDLSVKYLFQSALRESRAKIYVVNPETEQTLRVNYDKVFGNNNVIYEYVGKNNKDYHVVERFIAEHILSSSNKIGEFE